MFYSKFQIPNSKFHSGFTLLEMVLYLAIVSTAVVSFVYFIISISNSGAKTDVAQEVHVNGRAALNLISQRIRASTGVDLSPSSIFDTHPGKLSLDFNGIDATKDPTIIDLNINGVLQIKEGAGPIVAVTSNQVKITNLIFTNVTGAGVGPRENIRINVTVEYNNTSGNPIYTYSKSFTTAVSVRQ